MPIGGLPTHSGTKNHPFCAWVTPGSAPGRLQQPLFFRAQSGWDLAEADAQQALTLSPGNAKALLVKDLWGGWVEEYRVGVESSASWRPGGWRWMVGTSSAAGGSQRW